MTNQSDPAQCFMIEVYYAGQFRTSDLSSPEFRSEIQEPVRQVAAEIRDEINHAGDASAELESKPGDGSTRPQWPDEPKILHAPHPCDWFVIVSGASSIASAAGMAWQLWRDRQPKTQGKVKARFWIRHGRETIDLDGITKEGVEALFEEGEERD